MKIFLLVLLIPSIFAHNACCGHNNRQWNTYLSLSTTNTSDNYYPTNHHQGLALDHSHLSSSGPAGEYFDASASLAFNTSKKNTTKKILFKKKLEELSLKTTKKAHNSFGAKAGRFASYINPANQRSCCSNYFIKRPLLYRGFLGGHLIDDGAHLDYTIDHSEINQTILGLEAFHGKGLMNKSNKVGLFAAIARHKTELNPQNDLDISLSILENTLYNQKISRAHNHVGCCQASSYTGKHMFMSNLELTSKLAQSIIHTLTAEGSRINKLANRYGKNKHHLAYSVSSVTAFQQTHIGTLEAGFRFDHLNGIKFCSHDGPYFSKTIEKTFLFGFKPCEKHSLRFEHTTQKLKNQRNNKIIQINYRFQMFIF